MRPSLIAAIACAACAADPATERDLALVAAGEAGAALRGVEALHDAVGLRADPAAPSCVPTVGSCAWCTSWEGHTVAGRFAVTPTQTPCGADGGGPLALGYRVDSGALDGVWTATRDGWDVRAVGTRVATVGDTWTTRLTLQALDATVTADAVRDWALVGAMTGPDGALWTVDLSGDREQVYGELVGPARACAVSGTVGSAPDVDCQPL